MIRRRSLFKNLPPPPPVHGVPAGAGSMKPESGLPPVVHINPFANGITWNGHQHGGPPWKGVCIAGLWVGTHFFPRRGVIIAVSGVFGRVGNRPGLLRTPCKNPVKYRCRLMRAGQVLPFWWLSCGQPDHMNGACVIEHLDSRGFVTETEYVTTMSELEAPAVLPQLPPSTHHVPAASSAPAPPPPVLPTGQVPRAMLTPAKKGGSRRGWGKSL